MLRKWHKIPVAKYSPLPQVVNGITINTYVGKWKIDAWQTELDVKYFWSSKIIS